MKNTLYQDRLPIFSFIILSLYVFTNQEYIMRHLAPLDALVFVTTVTIIVISTSLLIKKSSFKIRFLWALTMPAIGAFFGFLLMALIGVKFLDKNGSVNASYIEYAFVFAVMPFALTKIWVLNCMLIILVVIDQYLIKIYNKVVPMKLIVQPAGNEYGLDIEPVRRPTSIVSVSYDYHTGLRIIVATSPKSSFEDLSLEYLFEYPRGYRLLHEFDLLRFWNDEAFSSHHHLYEIIAGGWLEQEKQFPEAYISEKECKEWFIRTSDLCMNILCQAPPLIRELPSISSQAMRERNHQE